MNNLRVVQIIAELCRDFCSLNDASHHKNVWVFYSSLLWNRILHSADSLEKKLSTIFEVKLKLFLSYRKTMHHSWLSVNAIKLFFFVASSHLHPSLIFADKDRNLPLEWSLVEALLGYAPALTDTDAQDN